MSILFPKINKPRQWDYRPIYYDEDKYERQKRLESMKAQAQKEAEEALTAQATDTQAATQPEKQESAQPYHTTLHRGSFREARDNNSVRVEEGKKANRRFVIILFILIVIAAIYFVL